MFQFQTKKVHIGGKEVSQNFINGEPLIYATNQVREAEGEDIKVTVSEVLQIKIKVLGFGIRGFLGFLNLTKVLNFFRENQGTAPDTGRNLRNIKA